jgi:hypothetical protein
MERNQAPRKRQFVIPRIHDPRTYDYEMSPDGAMTPREQERRKATAAKEHDEQVIEELGRRLRAIGAGL